MPPAFNLSQDQTLQFNLCLLALLPPVLLPGRSLKILTVTSLLKQRISFVRTFDNLSIQQRFRTAGTSSNAHTYRLLIVKDRIRYCLAVVCESFCSSAAEEEDYAVFRLTRQPLIFLQHQRCYQNT
jgi:hypothetical protein